MSIAAGYKRWAAAGPSRTRTAPAHAPARIVPEARPVHANKLAQSSPPKGAKIRWRK